MKKVSLIHLPLISSSHEKKINPGAFKKILFTHQDILHEGRIQMINWAVIPSGRQFVSHYHEDMDEIFIMITGEAQIIIDGEEDVLTRGDSVLIPMKSVHQMRSISKRDVEYLVIGFSLGKGGKTVIVESS